MPAASPRRARLAVPAALALAAIAGCNAGATRKADVTIVPQDVAAHGYIDPRPAGSYPSSKQRIQGWINANQMDSIRAHGWDIWRAITAPASGAGLAMPVWQTWYSGHELFEMALLPTATARPGKFLIPAERPRQFLHARQAPQPAGRGMARATRNIPVDLDERVLAFNRFSSTTARYIWTHRLNNAAVLADTNAKLGAAGASLASRQVMTSGAADTTDPLSFVIKPVFQFIRSDTITAIPYWAGWDTLHTRKAASDSMHPPPRDWLQAVAVDPTGTKRPGDSVFMQFNQDVPPAWLRIVPLDRFYTVRLTEEEAYNITWFGAVNGDFLGIDSTHLHLASDTSWKGVCRAAKPGNLALLMAMHVTGKEIANWTWQSFWWTPAPTDSLRRDQPRDIPAPWNSYAMTTAYHMDTTAVAFNPYLETSLFGTTEANVPWTGVTTNCMSCHRRAAIAYPKGLPPAAPAYGPAAIVSPGDSTIFVVPDSNTRVPTLKTDFLWSVAIRATTPGAQRAADSTVRRWRRDSCAVIAGVKKR